MDEDPIVQSLQAMADEVTPKPMVGKPRSDKLATVMEGLLTKPDFPKIMKVCEKYPRPENVPSLVIPDLPKDVDKTIDARAVK